MKLPDDFKVTYADVSFGDYHKFKSYQDVELTEMLIDALTKNNARNQFFAILTKGVFRKIRTRSSKKSYKPYPSLGKLRKIKLNSRLKILLEQ